MLRATDRGIARRLTSRIAGALLFFTLAGCTEHASKTEPIQRASSRLTVPGLVAAYGFDEGSGTAVLDATDGNHDTVLTGQTRVGGKYGGALDFDENFLTVAGSASLDLSTGFSLSAWVGLEAPPNWNTVAIKQAEGVVVYGLYAGTESRPGTFASIDGEELAAVSEASLPVSAWSHVAATYDGSFLRLFVNGEQAESTPASGSLDTGSGPLSIGGNASWEEYFPGIIDELRIYDHALTVTELRTDIDTPINPTGPDTTAPVVDLTLPANNGKVAGPVTIHASASDNVNVTAVKFLIDGTLLAEDTWPPFAASWDSTGASVGPHDISVQARDPAENTATSAVTVTVVPDALVAAYGFDEGTGGILHDTTGNGHDAELTNQTWVEGKYGTALAFTNDFIAVADSPLLDLTTGVTISAWVAPAASHSIWPTIALKEKPGGLSYALYSSWSGSDPAFCIGALGTVDECVVGGDTPLQTWTHLAGTYDGSEYRLYVNGDLVNSAPQPTPAGVSDEPLRIGGNNIWEEFFTGSIDELRIYARPLTAPEIAAEMGTPTGCSGTIDDANPCTTDTCTPATGITHTPVPTGTSCANQNTCDGTETCNATGVCVAGTPITCTALDQCHDPGTCDPSTGLCSTPTKPNGTACTDGDTCTQTDACQAGACTGTNPVTCVATDACHSAGTCNPATGLCSNPSRADGTPCNDATVCNGNEACSAGTCAPGTPPTLNDQNPCTADACDPIQGVVHTPVAAGTACSDANICNGAETCNGTGTCTAGTPPALSDGNPCTADACDPVAGILHTPVPGGTSCNDFDLCNGSELCDANGACQSGTPVIINTSNPCSVGSCDPPTGVITYSPAPQGTECFIDVCSLAVCNASGECTSAGSVVEDDGDPCTVEWCDPELGPQVKACSVLDRTVGTTLHESMKWLYTGDNPPQVGVSPSTMVIERTVVLRGAAKTRDGSPLPSVTISVLNHPEFGYTLTHSDGHFDMVVNGGGTLVIDYQREGYLGAQRNIATSWGQHAVVSDVVMIPPDPVVTTIDLTAPSGDFQVAQASIQTDDDGTRQGTLLVPSGTVATMHHPNGSTSQLGSMAVRITEFTVGDSGEQAMPAPLPGESKYTHAFEVNADEAIAADSESVTFSTPLVYYVDNFLYFPAGTTVPLGSFDRSAGAWKAEQSGVVLDIVSHTAGLADIDVTGDRIADPPSALAPHGITDAEREQIATLYEPGRTLWRLRIPHFTTPWDANWGGGPPPDADPPNSDPPRPDEPPPCPGGGGVNNASFIECEGQVLHETIPIAGTPYSLNYSSARVPGRTASNQITIPLSGPGVPASLLRIELDIEIGGTTHHQEFPPAANQTTTFTWDGLDAFDRRPQGTQLASVRLSYVYEYTYTKTERFGYNGNGISLTVQEEIVPPPPGGWPIRGCDPLLPPGGTSFSVFSASSGGGGAVSPCANQFNARTRRNISLARNFTVPIGALDARALGFGGWTLNVHHTHELLPQRLELGTGKRVDASVVAPVFHQIAQAGVGAIGNTLAAAPDGTLYSAAGTRVWRNPPGQGVPVVFAGTGKQTYGGDGLPATDPAVGFNARDIALGRDNSVYLADMSNQLVRRIGPDGIITSVAGIPGVRNPLAPEGPATQTALGDPENVAVAPDGTLYVCTASNIMRIGTDGEMTRIAGTRSSLGHGITVPPDGAVATDVRLEPRGVALSPDGTLFAILTGGDQFGADSIGTTIVKIVDGLIYRVAGGCLHSCPAWVDGDVARSLTIRIRPTGLEFDKNGALYISDVAGNNNGSFDRAATLTPDGRLYAIAGNGTLGGAPPSIGAPATARTLEQSGSDRTIALGPNGLFLGSWGASGGGTSPTVYRIGVPLPADTGANSVIAARDSDAFYAFDRFGRQLLTRHSLTGAELIRFTYDSSGRVIAVRDEAGKVTTIERDPSGNPLAITGPFGQRTEFFLDANGYLASVADPEGHETSMAYSSGGLLETFTNARGLMSSMQYDNRGRLQVDSDAAGGSHTLTRTESGPDWTVERSTALGRTTRYVTTRDFGGRQQQATTSPSNDIEVIEQGPDQIFETTLPDGTRISTAENPDTRFGLNAPVVTRTTTLPSGLTSTEATTRTYGGLNPSDILTFVDRTDQRNINGRTWRTRYTKADRTFTTTSPLTRTSTRIIDTLGRTTRTQVTGLQPIDYIYDSSGRLERITQATRTTTNTYIPTGASAGFLNTITDALNIPTTYTRDALGRTLTETRAATTTAFTWDPLSNLQTVTPPTKPTHGMTYTPVNLLETYSPPPAGLPSSGTGYNYDLDRMLRTETRPTGDVIVRTPDAAGRLDTVAIPGGLIDYDYYPPSTPSGAGKTSDIRGPYGTDLHFAYDGMLATSTAWSGDVTGSVAWQYNTDFDKIRETVTGQTGSSFAVFGYDNDQLLTCASPVDCAGSSAVNALRITRNTQNGLITSIALGATSEVIGYSSFGEYARQTVTFNSAPLLDLIYHGSGVTPRDNLGRITQKSETILGTTKLFGYTYDNLRRLTDVTVNGTLAEHFEYDANGNRTLGYNAAAGTTHVGVYDDQDRLLSYGAWVFTYTANGELETKANTVTGEAWLFQYDALGNLLSVGLPNGDLVEYLVDGMGRRVGKKKNGVLLKQWIYRDTLKPVAELDGAGNLVSQFVYGAKSNVPDYVLRGGATYRVVSDHLGSPRHVVNVANTSDVPFTASYSSFGVVTGTGTGLDWMPFGFAGGIYDSDSGLMRFGARDHDPSIGRWTSKDPIRFAADLNFYAYVNNDPINVTDPSGLEGLTFGSITADSDARGARNLSDWFRNNSPESLLDDFLHWLFPQSPHSAPMCGGGAPPPPPDCGQVNAACNEKCTDDVLMPSRWPSRDRGPDFQRCVQACRRAGGC